MMSILHASALALCLLSLSPPGLPSSPAADPALRSLVDLVDPFVGTGAAALPPPCGIAAKWKRIKEPHGNLHPGACLPFGMVSACSFSSTYPTGYGHRNGTSYGISHFQQSGTGHIQRYYNFLLVAPHSRRVAPTEKLSLTRERTAPGYYACTFGDTDAEVTVSRHAAFHRYTFPEGQPWHLKVNIGHIFMADHAKRTASITLGTQSARGVVTFAPNLPLYFHAQLDTPNGTVSAWQGRKQLKTHVLEVQNGRGAFGVTFSGDSADGPVHLNIGFSFRSVDQAEANLKHEWRGQDFDACRGKASDAWENALSRIRVEGGAPEQQRIFYTALYRSLIKPIDLTGESPFWNDETPLYLDVATMWDVYKTQMPLLLSVYPERGADIVRSLIALYDHFAISAPSRNAFLLSPNLGPSFSQQGWALCHQVIAHAHQIGLDSIDWNASWPILLRALGNRPPAGKLAIDDSYAASCLVPVAEAVGDEASAHRLLKRSRRWRAQYDPATAKLKGSSFYQGTAWNYSYMVWHDVDALIALHGSEARLIEDLDILFGFGDGEEGRTIGRFQGLNNQADIDVPYMYGFVGRHDRIADIVRTAMTYSFGQGRGGLAGNDDSGALSAWYVWNAIGLFPIVGQDIYMIGSPLFSEITITIGSTPFRISAPDTTDTNRYVIGARLNGKPLSRGFLYYDEIAQGGSLELTMSSRPGRWPTLRPQEVPNGAFSAMSMTTVLASLPPSVFDNTTEGITRKELDTLIQHLESDNWRVTDCRPNQLTIRCKRPNSTLHVYAYAMGTNAALITLTLNERATSAETWV